MKCGFTETSYIYQRLKRPGYYCFSPSFSFFLKVYIDILQLFAATPKQSTGFNVLSKSSSVTVCVCTYQWLHLHVWETVCTCVCVYAIVPHGWRLNGLEFQSQWFPPVPLSRDTASLTSCLSDVLLCCFSQEICGPNVVCYHGSCYSIP